MLTVYTAPIHYPGPDRLDVTRAHRDPVGVVFAPSWELLECHHPKMGDGNWWLYSTEYQKEMRESYRQRRATWGNLLTRTSATLVCLCADPKRCHRTLLADILVKCGAEYHGERQRRPLPALLTWREDGWAEHRASSWVQIRSGIVRCLHCGIEETQRPGFEREHALCCWDLDQQVKASVEEVVDV
ncbi:MAG: DUF488 family protein, N3 subclade [Candidatus Xenobia bacterium]